MFSLKSLTVWVSQIAFFILIKNTKWIFESELNQANGNPNFTIREKHFITYKSKHKKHLSKSQNLKSSGGMGSCDGREITLSYI